MPEIDGHPTLRVSTRRVLTAVAVVLVVVTGVGIVALRSGGSRHLSLRPTGPTVPATVLAVRMERCPDSAPGDHLVCVGGSLRLRGGQRAPLAVAAVSNAPRVDPGDEVLATAAPGGGYDVVSFRRRGPLLGLVAGIVLLLLVVVGGWRGLRAAVALAIAGLVIVTITVPALLDGRNPTAVTATSAIAIVVVVTALVHGVDARARVALLGAAAGVGVALGAADALRRSAQLASLSESVPGYLHVASGRLPVEGLVLAAIVIGATGAAVELAVRQVDATWVLRDAPATWRGVTAAGLRRGRAALAGTSTLLALAFAGAALPAVVLLVAGDQSVLDTVRGETVVVELARLAAGVAGLAAVVPITTAVAAAVVVREARSTEAGDPRRFRSRRERRLWQEDT